MVDFNKRFATKCLITAFCLQAMFRVSEANQSCPAGFTGSNCSTDINDCIGVSCSGNGNCSDRVDGYICFCNSGFFGINCEVGADTCSPNPCKNNGTCIKQGISFTCNCVSAYEGTRCESKKPPITFSVTTKLRNRQYISDLADLTKPNTRALILELTNIFQPFFMKMFPDFLAISFLGFSSGSLVTNFDVTFEATSNVSSSNIIQALTTANNSRDLQFLIFEEITVMSVGNMNTPSETPTDSSSQLATWEIILIITGVVLFIILVILVIFLVLYRRKVYAHKETVPGHSDWEKNASIKKREV